MIKANWYFDFISPFSYLQLARFDELPPDFEVAIKPVLFSGLLEHWGHKGPAEIPAKRRFVYRFFKWQSARRGIPFKMPPVHPFNPLPPLRLAILGGSDRRTVQTIYHYIYGEGHNLESEESVNEVGARLGIADAYRGISQTHIKEALRANTNEALSQEVFGLPAFVVDGELFWGDDSTEMLLDYLKNPALFKEDEMHRLSTLPMGLLRRAGT